MRLLYILPLLSTMGGQERTITDKANWLSHHGHQVMLVTYEHEGPLAYRLDNGVGHEDVGCHFFSLYRYSFFRRPLEALRLKRLFRKKLQAILQRFRPDVIVVPIPNTENFLPDIVRMADAIPVVIESHLAHGHQVIRRGFTERWLHYVYSPLRALRKARLLISLTEGDARYWRKMVRHVRVIPNPLASDLPPLTSHLSLLGSHRIIAVGRLTPQKRLDRLVDAFALLADKYPQWTIDIFGEGECHQQLQEQIDRLHLSERVRIHPPTHQIFEEYRRSDLFVLSSDFEGFGLVIIEAMACGLPVVATNCPYGPSEIIEDGKTGLLAQLDVATLAAKMEWLITHDAERRQMGQAAQQAVARYRLDRVMPEWEKAYLGS